MSYLLMLAAVSAAQKQRARSRAAARRRANEKQKEKGSNRSSSYPKRELGYLECVVAEAREDHDLSEFLKTLERKAQMVRREAGKENELKARQTFELMKKYGVELERLEEMLKQNGISLSFARHSYYSMRDFEIDQTEHSQMESYAVHAMFNGIFLSEPILTDPSNQNFQDNYDMQHKKCDELRTKKVELEKRLKKVEFWEAKSPFNKDKRRMEIAQLRKEMEEIEKEIEKEEKYRRELEVFRSMTPEQKELILKYIRAGKCIEQAHQLLYRQISEFQRCLPAITDQEVIKQAVDRTVKEKGMQEKDVAEIFKKLDKVAIKRFRGEYPSYLYRETGDCNKEIIEGFVKHIYEEDEEFVDRNMEEVLEDEKNR